ncbi:MAG TPA: glycosyl hydrolase, partial [Acidimicrobiales bacterium]|nr:glycosyl hydrolase [Acidimicrobiales bacterium]
GAGGSRGTGPDPAAVEMGIFSDLPGMTLGQSIAYREAQLGRTFAIDAHFYAWTDQFPGGPEENDVAHGRIPLENWWGVSVAAINDGSQDSVIMAAAERLKAFGHPVFLRPLSEMNGDWFPWSGDPQAFIAAWRHIWDIFHQVGAANVSWVWAPNADSHPGGTDPNSPNNWTRYYPGDRYVDWVGIDGYNWGETTGFTWQSFGSIFQPVYDDYESRKPIMIAEVSSLEWNPAWGTAPAGDSKASWIGDAGSWLKSHPDVKAVVWYDTNRSRSEADWRVDSSASSLRAYHRLVADPYFQAPGSVRG